MKPIKRSAIRIMIGKRVFTLLRHKDWVLGKHKFANKINTNHYLSNTIFEHSSPLIRDLKGLEIELQYNKIENLRISIDKINGIVINPGETFSFWKLVGKPSKSKGYLDGLVLKSGGLTSGVGGGLCQLTNLIYWMALHSQLEVVERYRHSYDVFPDSGRSQPFGSGATCVYNYRDLMIKNPTDQRYQLRLYMDDERLYGSIQSEKKIYEKYEVYEKKHWITPEYWGGYMRHNMINRKIYDSAGEIILDDLVAENHAIMMYQPFLSEK